jgi:uncharacterized protein (DUF1778 family)
MTTKTKSKLKPKKDEVILVRATKAQKQMLRTVAQKHGMGLSTWLLSAALEKAHV